MNIFKQTFKLKQILAGGGLIILANLLLLLGAASGLFALPLALASLFIIVYLLGYWLRIIRINTFPDDFQLPQFKDKTLIKSGLKLLGVIIVYLIAIYAALFVISAIVMLLTFSVGFGIFGIPETDGQGLGWVGVFISIGLAFLIVYPYIFITMPAALTSFLQNEKITDALNFKRIFLMFKQSWKKSCATGAAIFVLMILSGVCYLWFPFISVYCALIIAKLIKDYRINLRIEKGNL